MKFLNLILFIKLFTLIYCSKYKCNKKSVYINDWIYYQTDDISNHCPGTGTYIENNINITCHV